MINRNCVLWFVGPENNQKTETAKLFKEELISNNFTIEYCDLDHNHDMMPAEQVGKRTTIYLGYNNIKRPLVTVCDGSLLKTMVDIELNPFSQETKEVEQQKLFEYECYVIPNNLVPTHIVLFVNPPKDKTPITWEKYKKELDAYEKVLKKSFISNAFRDLGTKLIRLSYNTPEERVNPLFSAIQ